MGLGSLFLFLLGVSAPFVVAMAVMRREERQRRRMEMRLERADQDNRGLKLALSTTAPRAGAAAGNDQREVDQLLEKLAQNGILLDWLRLGANAPAEASAKLKGAGRSTDAVIQQAIAEWGAQGVATALDRLKGRLAAIADMELVWADPHTHLRHDMSEMLARTMWVFEPEYVVDENRFAIDPSIGAVAKPKVGAAMGPGQHKDGEPTLVVELKGARVTVGADQQQQAWNNVRELIRAGAVRERDPVEVFVVGGAVDELDGNPRVEGRYRNVRITSCDYAQLIARANRLTFGLYDELKDQAPFLRRHREEIATAQQAAMNEAATEASAPPPDEPVRAAAQADTVRRAQYAEPTPQQPAAAQAPAPQFAPPRQSGFEGDHIVIGKRRYAAR